MKRGIYEKCAFLHILFLKVLFKKKLDVGVESWLQKGINLIVKLI